MPKEADEETFRQMFAKCGFVERVKIKRSTRRCYLRFDKRPCTFDAVEMANRRRLFDEIIKVERAADCMSQYLFAFLFFCF